MRASSLSDKTIVDLLSRYFIPVWLSTDDFDLVPKDRAEADEYWRYRKLAKEQGLCAGNVQIYLILPDGKLLTTLHVTKASQPETLRALLQKTVEDNKLEPRAAEGRGGAAVRPRQRAKDAAEFHVAARNVGLRAGTGLSECWVPMTVEETTNFVPRQARADFSWEVPAATANKLYLQFFPPGPNYKPDGSVASSSLTATVAAVDGDRVLVRLRGKVHLKHRVGGKDTDGDIRARVSGYALVDAKAKKLSELGMVTDEAEFVWHWQGYAQPSKMAAFVEYDAP